MFKLRIYKKQSFLIFEFDDGKKVKYNFADHTSIGKRGGIVKGLSGQLRNLSIGEMLECCEDKKYAKFIKWVADVYKTTTGCRLKNIGTVLNKVEQYSSFEQLFSSGIENIDADLQYSINNIPIGLIKICRANGVPLSNKLVDVYKLCPDAINTAFSLPYLSLTPADVNSALLARDYRHYDYHAPIGNTVFTELLRRYGYNAKSLLLYIDHLKAFEAMDGIEYLVRELQDYCAMMHRINPRFDKYPKHFLTTHKIAARNYNRLKQTFDENAFAKRINTDMEYEVDEFCFIYPKSTEAIKEEAVNQNNCVASYIDRVIDGSCDILFLRYKDEPDKSLVTIQVVDGEIVQARQHYNYPCTDTQNKVIKAWNTWYKKKKNSKAA